jgi:hypothetical protein
VFLVEVHFTHALALFMTQQHTHRAAQNGHRVCISPYSLCTPYFFLSNCRSMGGAAEWREPYRGGGKGVELVPVAGGGGRAQRNRRRRRFGTFAAGRAVAVPRLGVPRGISAARSTELGHGGAREAGSSNGGVELGAATASSWAVVASSSVMRGRVRRQDRRVCHSRRRVHLATHRALG